MSRLDGLYLPLFLVSLLVWFGLSVYVLLDRWSYDRRERRLQQALEVLCGPGLQGLEPAAWQAAVERVLLDLPPSLRGRLLLDPALPAAVAEAFSRGQVARRGLDRLLREASATAGERAKWKRLAAFTVLARLRHPEAHVRLGAALQDPDPDVAGTAVALLGSLQDPPAAEILVAALPAGTFPASRIAAQLDAFPAWIAPMLRPLLSAASVTARYWAALLLARFADEPGLEPELARLCADPEPAVRKAAVQSLAGHSGAEARAALEARLGDPVGYVRAHALRALAAFGAGAPAARIAAALGDPDWTVRHAAREALVGLGEPALAATAAVLAAEDKFARNGAAEVLQDLGFLERWAAEALADPGGEAAGRLAGLLRAGGSGMLQVALDHPDPQRRTGLAALLEARGLRLEGQAP